MILPRACFLGRLSIVSLFFLLVTVPDVLAMVYGRMRADYPSANLRAGDYVLISYDAGEDWVLGNTFSHHVPKSLVQIIKTYKYSPILKGKANQKFVIYREVPPLMSSSLYYPRDDPSTSIIQGMTVEIIERQGEDYIVSFPSATDPRGLMITARLPSRTVNLEPGQIINEIEESIPLDPNPKLSPGVSNHNPVPPPVSPPDKQTSYLSVVTRFKSLITDHNRNIFNIAYLFPGRNLDTVTVEITRQSEGYAEIIQTFNWTFLNANYETKLRFQLSYTEEKYLDSVHLDVSENPTPLYHAFAAVEFGKDALATYIEKELEKKGKNLLSFATKAADKLVPASELFGFGLLCLVNE